MTLLLLIVAIVLFLLAAIMDFGWFGASGDHIIGLMLLGLAAFAAAHLPIRDWVRR